MSNNLRMEMEWIIETCDRHPRWAWVGAKGGGVLYHQLPGWNRVPPARDENYITEGEKRMVAFLDEELPGFITDQRHMIKLHLRL